MPDEPTPHMEKLSKACTNKVLAWLRSDGVEVFESDFKAVYDCLIEAMMNEEGMCRDRRGGWRQLGMYDG